VPGAGGFWGRGDIGEKKRIKKQFLGSADGRKFLNIPTDFRTRDSGCRKYTVTESDEKKRGFNLENREHN